MTITPMEDIYVISKITGIKYFVRRMELEKGKIKRYFIKNQGYLEWWDSSRFYEPMRIYSRCEYCCEHCWRK